MDGSPLTHVVPVKKTQLETEAHTLVQSVRITKARIYRVSAFRLLVAWWCGGDSLGELWAPCNPHSLQLLLTLPIHLWLQCPIFWCCFQQENNPRHKAHFCWYFTQKHDSRIQANTAVISNKLFIDTIINSQHCNKSTTWNNRVHFGDTLRYKRLIVDTLNSSISSICRRLSTNI